MMRKVTNSFWIFADLQMSFQVTIITMSESLFEPRENHRLVHIDGVIEKYMSFFPPKFSEIKRGSETMKLVFDVGIKTFELIMEHPAMKKFLQQDNQFDLVVVESFGTEGFYGFGEHFNAPLIGLSTTVPTGQLNHAVGNSDPWSFVPNQFLHSSPVMTFTDRFNNAVLNIYEYFLLHQYLFPNEDRLMKKFFPKNKKSLEQILANDVCLGFTNNHFTLSLPRPYSPNMIEIGGIHLHMEKGGKLPEEFKQFLDSATDGVIVFSLGSILRASEWKEKDRQAFINVFSKLKQKVIWRYDLPNADQLPKNILGRSWIPQKEILAHPNVKVFITHGGMLGTTEAVFNGLPVLGMPFFGDQHVNIARAIYRGYAVKIDRYNITEENFNGALQELLTDPKYMRNAKAFSIAFADKPMSPPESVVFWSEYVIRNKCAPFMKVNSHKMGIIAFNNIDVWACMLLFVLGFAWFFYLLIKVVFCALCHFGEKIKND